MTYLLPNHFLDNASKDVIVNDNLFTFVYASREGQNNFMIRNTMHAMIMLVEGTKKVTFLDNTSQLDPGSILFLEQGNYVMSEIMSNQGKYEALLVYFDDRFVLDFIHKHQVSFEKDKQTSLCTFSKDAFLSTLIDSFKLYIDKNLEHTHTIVKLKCEELFLYLLSSQKRVFSAFLNAIVKTSSHRTSYILEANLDLIESVEDMSRVARVSKNELRKELENQYGMSPKVWLDAKRLEKAALLLKTSHESISSIATSCGYSSLSWFGVQFKKSFDMTPKAYREKTYIKG